MKLIDKRLADLKARQEAGAHLPCPRCGRMTMKEKLHTNALSRIADMKICDSCGTDEAKLAFMNAPNCLYQWAALQPNRPDGDFKAVSGEEAMKIICCEQSGTLVELFMRAEAGDDADEIRFTAFESLPGLTELWTQPFQATYRAKDGTVMIRVRQGDGQVELAADLIDGK